MKSAPPGTPTSTVEVLYVTTLGLRLMVDGRELFAAFRDFPWFEEATIRQLTSKARPNRPSRVSEPANSPRGSGPVRKSGK